MGGVECWWVGRNRDSEPISGFITCCQSAATGYRCYQHDAAGRWQVVTLTAGSKRRSLLMAGDDEMFMTRNLNVTPKTTEHHLIVRSDKSVAHVTNNKRLRSTFCAIEANY